MFLSIFFVSSNILFFTGLYGFFYRRDNLILSMVLLEISLLGSASFFVATSILFNDYYGGLVFFMLLTLAAVESALGLALVIAYYRVHTSISWSLISA